MSRPTPRVVVGDTPSASSGQAPTHPPGAAPPWNPGRSARGQPNLESDVHSVSTHPSGSCGGHPFGKLRAGSHTPPGAAPLGTPVGALADGMMSNLTFIVSRPTPRVVVGDTPSASSGQAPTHPPGAAPPWNPGRSARGQPDLESEVPGVSTHPSGCCGGHPFGKLRAGLPHPVGATLPRTPLGWRRRPSCHRLLRPVVYHHLGAGAQEWQRWVYSAD